MGKGVISYYPNTESKPNPIVARQRNPWPLVVLVVAAVAVLYLLDGIWETRTVAPVPPPVSQQPAVNNITIIFPTTTPGPTRTPTATPTPIPTATQTLAQLYGVCGTPSPGSVCVVPTATLAAPPPVPNYVTSVMDCRTALRGAVCFWPTPPGDTVGVSDIQ